jgi:Protein of unknown function (DUF561)
MHNYAVLSNYSKYSAYLLYSTDVVLNTAVSNDAALFHTCRQLLPTTPLSVTIPHTLHMDEQITLAQVTLAGIYILFINLSAITAAYQMFTLSNCSSLIVHECIHQTVKHHVTDVMCLAELTLLSCCDVARVY